MEGLADRFCADAPSFRKGEQRQNGVLIAAIPLFHILCDPLGQFEQRFTVERSNR